MASSIPATQTAAIITDFTKPLEIKKDYPVKQASELAPGECLVELEYSGVCHSDLHVARGEWTFKAPLPRIGGHEGIGHIVAIGNGTENSPVKIGDRVGIKWIGDVCGKCEMCSKGSESSCLRQPRKTSGFTVDGTFQKYAVSYTNYVTPIPEELDSCEGTPILCAGLTVYKALKQTNTKPGDWVAISGAGGGLGHLAIQYAKAMGLKVVAIDTGKDKQELVTKLGAEKWVDFRESKSVVQDVMAAADGLGPHAAVIAAGIAAPFNEAPLYIRPTGTLVMVGMPGDSFFHIPITLIIAKSLRIVGSSIGSQADVKEALDLAAKGKVKCHTTVKTIDDVNQVMDDLQSGNVVGRVVMKL